MKFSVKYAVWLLASLVLVQGCDHKTQMAQTQPLAPPIVDTPLPKPATVSPADLPPPVVGPATPPKPAAEPPKPAEAPKKPVRHAKKPTASAPAPAVETAQTTPPAANPGAPSVSAIGQLSGGASGDLRSETEEAINATDKGVNAITRSLNDTELKTAAQIREFLRQAREALTSGDVDGAHILANKAKVLLTELNSQ